MNWLVETESALYTRGDLEIDLEILETLRHRARQALINGETGPGKFEKLMAKFDELEKSYRQQLAITALRIQEREADRKAGRKPRWLGKRKYDDGIPRERKPRGMVEVIEGGLNDPNLPVWMPCKKELAMKMMNTKADQGGKPVRCVRDSGEQEGRWEILI